MGDGLPPPDSIYKHTENAVYDSTSVIEVHDLRKTYSSGLFRRRKVHALGGVSLTVPSGQIYGLLGPNGAGKTTLIKVLLGIVRRTGGNATVLGQPAGSLTARRNIGYLPENHRIPRHLTGNTALEYYGSLSGLSGAEIRQRRPELLDQVGLNGREKDSVRGYSKGMLQRLGLAQAMLHKPDLIILDEPTDGVDPVGRKEIRSVLRRLADEGHSVFLNSHLLQEIELICDSVAILTQGTVRRTGSVKELTQVFEGAPIVMQVTGDEKSVQQALSKTTMPKIQQVAAEAFQVEVGAPDQSDVDAIIDSLRVHGVSIWSLRRKEVTLEEAFLEIVGGAA